jgi:hypothetical protein
MVIARTDGVTYRITDAGKDSVEIWFNIGDIKTDKVVPRNQVRGVAAWAQAAVGLLSPWSETVSASDQGHVRILLGDLPPDAPPFQGNSS